MSAEDVEKNLGTMAYSEQKFFKNADKLKNQSPLVSLELGLFFIHGCNKVTVITQKAEVARLLYGHQKEKVLILLNKEIAKRVVVQVLF